MAPARVVPRESKMGGQDTVDKSWITQVRKTWKHLLRAAGTAGYLDAGDKLTRLLNWLESLQRDLAFSKGFFTFLDDTKRTDIIYKWRTKALGHLQAAMDVLARARRDIEFWDGVVTPGTREYRNGTGHRYALIEDAAKELGVPPPLSFREADEMAAANPRLVEKGLAKTIKSTVASALAQADGEVARKFLALLTKLVNRYGPVEWGTHDREFNIGNVKVVMKDLLYEGALREQGESRHPRMVAEYVRELVKAKRLLEQKGLGKLWYGTFLVYCKSCGGTNPRGAKFGVGAHYFPNTDHVVIYSDPQGLAKLVAHELGHRYYYKFMTQEDRARFDQWFGDVPAVSEYGGTISEEDFAEVFSYYIDNRDLTRDQLDRFKQFLKRAAKQADLQPPLGYPGGPCHVVRRIDKEVRNPRMSDKLIDLVEAGVSLTNPQAAQVYTVETFLGPWKFTKMRLSIHVQYRMDLRGITVPEVCLALDSFFRAYNEAKPKQSDRRAQALAKKWEIAMLRKDTIEWTDPRTKLEVVFAPDIARGQVEVISAWWKGEADPQAPSSCRVARAWTQRARPDFRCVASRWLRRASQPPKETI